MSGIFVNVGSLSRYGGRNGSLSRRLRPINPLTRATWLLFNNAGVLSPLVTATRSGTATFFDSTGTLQNAAANTPRVSYDPAALSLGPFLLAEESRTNIVFPSDTLTTQTRTVTAVAHTLSFYGTGTVTLSGATTATVAGIGAFPQRRVFTFTPAAGNLTLTVSGSVTLAQLEVGSTASSYIPTTTAAVTRSADNLSVTNLAATGFNAAGSTLYGDFQHDSSASFPTVLALNNGSISNRIVLIASTSTRLRGGVADAGVIQADMDSSVNYVLNTRSRSAIAIAQNNFAFSANGITPLRDTSGTVPAVTQLQIGFQTGGLDRANGRIYQAAIIPSLSDSALRRLTRI